MREIIKRLIVTVLIALAPMSAGLAQLSSAPDVNGAWPEAPSNDYQSVIDKAYKVMTPQAKMAAQGIYPGEICLNIGSAYPAENGVAIRYIEVKVSAAVEGSPEVKVAVPLNSQTVTITPENALYAYFGGINSETKKLFIFGAVAGSPSQITVSIYNVDVPKDAPNYTWTATITIPRDRMAYVELPGNPADGLNIEMINNEKPIPAKYKNTGEYTPVGGEITDDAIPIKDETNESGKKSSMKVKVESPAAGVIGQTIGLNASVTGTGSDVSYEWKQIRGPEITLSDRDKPVASFVPEHTGSYGFRVDVSSSGSVKSGYAEMNVYGESDFKMEFASKLTLESTVEGIVFYENKMYAMTQNDEGLTIYVYDIQDIGKPKRIGKYKAQIPGKIKNIHMRGGNLFVVSQKKDREEGMELTLNQLLIFTFSNNGQLALSSIMPLGNGDSRIALNDDILYTSIMKSEALETTAYDISDVAHPLKEWSEKFKNEIDVIPLKEGKLAVFDSPDEVNDIHNDNIKMFSVFNDGMIMLMSEWEDDKGICFAGMRKENDKNLEFVIGKIDEDSGLEPTASLAGFAENKDLSIYVTGQILAVNKMNPTAEDDFSVHFYDVNDISKPVEKKFMTLPPEIKTLAMDGRFAAVNYRSQLWLYKMY